MEDGPSQEWHSDGAYRTEGRGADVGVTLGVGTEGREGVPPCQRGTSTSMPPSL